MVDPSREIKLSPAVKWVLVLVSIPFVICMGMSFLGWLGNDDHFWSSAKPTPPPVAIAPPKPTPPAPPTRTELEARFDALTPKQVDEMVKLIESSQRDGLFGEIDWERGRVYVGFEWDNLDVQYKRADATVLGLELIHRKGKEESIYFLNRKTGKRVAAFYPSTGLKIDD